MTRLSPGDVAPAFTLDDDHGRAVSLSDYSGQQVILYAYPGCDDSRLHDPGLRLPGFASTR